MDNSVLRYLETQEKLQEKRAILQKGKCSERSRNIATKIANQQCNDLEEVAQDDFPVQIENKIDLRSDSDEDYVPSDGECKSPKIRNRVVFKKKEKIEKVCDDGDKRRFLERIEKWRKLKAMAKNCDDDSIDLSDASADVEYLYEYGETEDHKIDNRLSIPRYLWEKLYRYQKTGVKWLWELSKSETGGILGDEMGLGKTVQIIAFLCALQHSKVGHWHGLGPSIIITPATVVYQWVSHFHYWWPALRVAVLHQSGSFVGTAPQLVRDINNANGILLITYAGAIKHSKAISSQKWHYIILDEGHKIRNSDTQISRTVKNIETPFRIIVSGSPLQNNLQDLWSLFDFVSPGLLGSLQAFGDYFAVPITQGGYSNATPFQEATGLAIATSLKNLIAPYILRRSKAEVQEYLKLPEKSEQVLFCSLVDEQKDLYRGYLMAPTVRSILNKELRHGEPYRARVLVALMTLRKICNHPDLYSHEYTEGNEIAPADFGYWKNSGKMLVIDSLLKIWKNQGHRALIFTQSRAMLCLIEQYLNEKDYNYLKMDGSTSVGYRQVIIKKFNEDANYLVFLATTRVGGLGVNLTGADRVVIYDPDWNPATDTQAKERAWRIGQLRNVTVYRLITAGTIEEKIYQRQIFKQLLSNKILIDPRQKNLLKTSTLQGLFSLDDPQGSDDTETVNIFKHTKVELNSNKKDVPMGGGVIFTKEKLNQMREMARNLSRTLAQEYPSNVTEEKDPRLEYKLKREALLNPTQVEPEPLINLIDENTTNASFEAVLSEVDIINKHTKKNPFDFLEKFEINEVPSSSETTEQAAEDEPLETTNIVIPDEINMPTPKRKKGRKRKLSKEKTDHDSNINANQDDYVLSKLFAKSVVKNVLEHDKVLGLVAREERDRLKEEVNKRAKKALRALKKSRLNR